MKKAFTLVEVLIVVAILGILAALTAPLVTGYVLSAKESAAKENLQALRTAIHRYAIEHNDVPPGYPKTGTSGTPLRTVFYQHLLWGKYLNTIPTNPFNDSFAVQVLANTASFPATAPGGTTYGWIYKAATKEIRLNWPDNDSKGVRYYDY